MDFSLNEQLLALVEQGVVLGSWLSVDTPATPLTDGFEFAVELVKVDVGQDG